MSQALPMSLGCTHQGRPVLSGPLIAPSAEAIADLPGSPTFYPLGLPGGRRFLIPLNGLSLGLGAAHLGDPHSGNLGSHPDPRRCQAKRQRTETQKEDISGRVQQ